MKFGNVVDLSVDECLEVLEDTMDMCKPQFDGYFTCLVSSSEQEKEVGKILREKVSDYTKQNNIVFREIGEDMDMKQFANESGTNGIAFCGHVSSKMRWVLAPYGWLLVIVLNEEDSEAVDKYLSSNIFNKSAVFRVV